MVYINVTTSPVNALQTVNDLTIVYGAHMFADTVLIIVWLIVFTRTKAYEGTRANIAVASFFTTLMALPLAFLGLLSDVELGVLIALTALSLIPLITNR